MNDETSNYERSHDHPTDEERESELVQLQAGIEETRSDMSATISALEERLDPSEVKEKIKEGLAEARDAVKSDIKEAISDAKRAVRAATLGKVEDLATEIGDKMNETRDTLVNTVRSNPIPAAMVGVGLAWLLMNRSNSASRRRSMSMDEHDTGRSMTDAVGERVRGASHAAGNALHGASDAVTGLAHRAGDAASHMVDQAGDAAKSVAGGARRGAERVEQGFQDTLHEHPVAVGAAALALGAVVGFALPRTEREDALLGATRDRVLNRASDAAHDAADKVAGLAEKTGEKAKESLQQPAGT